MVKYHFEQNMGKIFKDIFAKNVKKSIEELILWMQEYDGKIIVETIVSSGAGQYAPDEFLGYLGYTDRKIEQLKADEWLHEEVETCFTQLAEDITAYCEVNNIGHYGYSFYVGYNESDGAIELYLISDDFEGEC
jgi:hypothetical protein